MRVIIRGVEIHDNRNVSFLNKSKIFFILTGFFGTGNIASINR